jgi:hypothetical protein
MKEVVKNYIIKILIDKDLSINQQIDKINIFLSKIDKMTKPNDNRFYILKPIELTFIL